MPNLPTNDCPICGDEFPALGREIHDRLLSLPTASAEEVMRLAMDLVEEIPLGLPLHRDVAAAFAPPAGFNPDLWAWASLHDPDGELFDNTIHGFLEYLGDIWRDQVVARQFTTAVWAIDHASDRLIPRLPRLAA